MIHFNRHFRRALARRFARDESGAASIEFVMTVPFLMLIFTAAFESGLFMTRSILLEQAVDLTMRELRLGHYPLPDADLLKTEICSRTVIFNGCEDAISIEMTRINTATWALPTTGIACTNRVEDIQPVTQLQIGQQNDIMLVRACVVQDAIFPTTGLGLKMAQDEEGGYFVTSVAAFVTEPN